MVTVGFILSFFRSWFTINLILPCGIGAPISLPVSNLCSLPFGLSSNKWLGLGIVSDLILPTFSFASLLALILSCWIFLSASVCSTVIGLIKPSASLRYFKSPVPLSLK